MDRNSKKYTGARRFNMVVLLGFVVWGFLIYSNTFNASFHFDDIHVFEKLTPEQLLNKSTLRGGGNRVVAEISFAFSHRLSGTNVFGYHLFNILVHIGTAFWVYIFLSLIMYQCSAQGPCKTNEANPPKDSITGTPSSQYSAPYEWHRAVWPALIGSALFLVHPLATQAVTYVTQRYTSLAAFFYIGSLACFVMARINYLGNRRFWDTSHLVWYVASFFLAVFAMLTKEISITLPVAVLITEYYFIKTNLSSIKSRTLYILPLLLTVFIIPGIRTMMSDTISLESIETLTTWAPTVARSSYFLTQLKIIAGTYLKLIIFPVGQNIDHSFIVSENLLEAPVIVSFLFLCALFGVGLGLFRRSKFISFGILWFFLTIAPTSSIVPNTEFVAEHRAYLPLMGLSFVVAGLPGWKNRWKRNVSVLLPVLLLASGLTYWRNIVWQTPLSLWADASEKSPARTRPLNNYARALREAGRLDEAAAVYQRGLAVPPEPWREGKDHYIAYNNLGNVYSDQKRFQEAIESFKKAAQIRPDSRTVLYNLGNAYEKTGEWQEAVNAYEKILEIGHSSLNLFPDVLFKLSEIHYAHGQPAKSENCLRRAIKIRPDFAEAYFNLAGIDLARGNYRQAVRLYDKVVSLRPIFAEAYYNKGNALAGLDRFDEAENSYRKAINLKPVDSSFYNNLGNILMLKEAYGKAKDAYETALSYNSDFASAHMNLGIIFSEHIMNKPLAIFHFKRFLLLAPNHPKRREVEAIVEKLE